MIDYQLLVFDWDGTLMDSSAKIVNCFNGAARDCDVSIPDAEEVRSYIGLSLVESFSRIYDELGDLEIEALTSRYREHWLHLDRTEMPLFPAVEEGLARLSSKGYLLSVATGKSHQGLVRAMDQTDLSKHFVYTRCADQSAPKPNPLMLEDILDYTGLSNNDAVMVGDTTFDMEMAKHAGVDGWGVSYGSHSAERLQPLSRHPVVDTFDQLVENLL